MSGLTVALAGNPNTGKTSLFNALTGASQHVGNWPGKTVERKEGTYVHDGTEYLVVDLPGTYSLHAASPEEAITRDFLLANQADVTVIVIDAANLERNLYLATQILEMGRSSVVALNMVDVAERRGDHIRISVLARHLGVPVVPTIARDGNGLPELRRVIAGLPARGATA